MDNTKTGFDTQTQAPALDITKPTDVQGVIADVEAGFTAFGEFQQGKIINSPVIQGTFLGETVDVRIQIVRKPDLVAAGAPVAGAPKA